MIKKILRLYHTIRYLKWQQIYYRFYYPVKRLLYREKKIGTKNLEAAMMHRPANFPVFSIDTCLYEERTNSFTFLNRNKTFDRGIDWKFKEYGLLWSFHLHYFDWLNDSHINVRASLAIVNQYIDRQDNSILFIHSFPASLRIINWIKFVVQNDIKDDKVIENIYKQAGRLASFPEYELMANHLLLNGIALVWAGYYFKERCFIDVGERIVRHELAEQILSDGAHFEKSVSYHSIVLRNMLDLYAACKIFSIDAGLTRLLHAKCALMYAHLSLLNDGNNVLPCFGDSNPKMTISFEELRSVAQDLFIQCKETVLGVSGFKKIEGLNYKLYVNSGNVNANYQPGHNHADAFTFCLNVNGFPVIVDRGISTYERSGLRIEERATSAHNTISLNEENSSDIWSAFRMGKRAKISFLYQDANSIDFEHNGYYASYKIRHRRTILAKENIIQVKDNINGCSVDNVLVYLHFHPNVRLIKEQDSWSIADTGIMITLSGCHTYMEEYDYCIGFNETKKANRLVGRCQQGIINTLIKVN